MELHFAIGLFLATLLLISATSNGFPQSIHLQGDVTESDYNQMILAASRTYRKDPLDSFNYYKGGWNISDKHYISSVVFSAAPLFFIAAIWLLGFGLCLFIICLHHFCCLRKRYGYSRVAYTLSLTFLVLFTIAAVVGCIVLYTGQGTFHSGTTHTLRYVVSQADNTAKNLSIVSDYLDAAKNIKLDHYSLPNKVQNNIKRVEKEINSATNTLEKETNHNSRKIKKALNFVRLALIVIAAVMLLLAFVGFLLSIFGMKRLVYALVLVGWILVTITFVLCGLFLVLHNAIGDGCVAMHEWVQNPTAHTALDDVLPCLDKSTAQETLAQSRDVIVQLVSLVNTLINISNTDFPPGFPLYHNQSGPLVPSLCNPFNPDNIDQICPDDEVTFSNAAQVWRNYICKVSVTGICITEGRLTPKYYDAMIAAANVSYALYEYTPFLADLIDCSFVRKTFTDISQDYCPNLKRESKWIFIGLVMISTSVMLSLIFWLFYARERRHRRYTEYFSAVSDQQQHSLESRQKGDTELPN